jgi:hypothetical protein
VKLIHYWERGVADTVKDYDGNPLIEITLLLKPNLEEDREQVVEAIDDLLEQLSKQERTSV